MTEYTSHTPQPRLFWVSPVTPDKLDSATWVDTTRELRAQGMDVTLVTAGPAGPHKYDGVEVLNIPRPNVYLLGQVLFHLNILRYLFPRRFSYDVVLFHQISAVWLLPLRFLGRRRPLLVMDSRDVIDVDNRNLKARLRTTWFRMVYWLSERLLDGQTVITPRMADLVGVPPEQLWGIWPSGVDIETFAPAHRERRWPASGKPVHMVYVGIFLEKRNLLPLVRAVIQANEEGMSFVLSLYGDGPLRPELETLAAESGGAVRIQQPIPHEQIPLALTQAQVGVTSLPEPDDVKYEASSPIKLFEYMAAGMPVLATDNKCHTDVVGDGRFAFWAHGTSDEDILEALREIWTQRQELRLLGHEAAAASHAWTWSAAARKLHGAIQYGVSHTGSHPAVAASKQSDPASVR
ncbi:MAG: glycosyltransferase family 4 protein [Chloroflexota bacterium]